MSRIDKPIEMKVSGGSSMGRTAGEWEWPRMGMGSLFGVIEILYNQIALVAVQHCEYAKNP